MKLELVKQTPDHVLAQAQQKRVYIKNSYRARTKIDVETRDIKNLHQDTKQQISAFLDDFSQHLAGKVEGIPKTFDQANKIFDELLNDVYLDLRELFTNLGRPNDYRAAAEDFHNMRVLLGVVGLQYRKLNAALHRMVRGECRAISKRLTRWISQHGAHGELPAELDVPWFHFHTVETCPRVSPRPPGMIIEHSVTLNHIHNRILGFRTPYDGPGDLPLDTVESIERFLRLNFIVAQLLKTQNDRILPEHVVAMPEGWIWRTNDDRPITSQDIGRYANLAIHKFNDRNCIECQNFLLEQPRA